MSWTAESKDCHGRRDEQQHRASSAWASRASAPATRASQAGAAAAAAAAATPPPRRLRPIQTPRTSVRYVNDSRIGRSTVHGSRSSRSARTKGALRRSAYDGLSGPSYSLAGEENRFHLPLDAVLGAKDGYAGEVDLWPAPHSARTKPRLLLALEEYVVQECKRLGVPDTGPSEGRLQVYRDCFQYLIEHFTVYQSLLSRIKQEYEDMLQYHAARAQKVPFLESRLATIEHESRSTIRSVKAATDRQIDNFRTEADELRNCLHEARRELRELRRAATNHELKERHLQQELNEAKLTEETLCSALTRYDASNREQERARIADAHSIAALRQQLRELQGNHDDTIRELHVFHAASQSARKELHEVQRRFEEWEDT